jgi:hypothetical protein
MRQRISDFGLNAEQLRVLDPLALRRNLPPRRLLREKDGMFNFMIGTARSDPPYG